MVSIGFTEMNYYQHATCALIVGLSASALAALYLLFKGNDNIKFEDQNGSTKSCSRAITIKRSIPRIYVGEIIGKNGESIKAIQKKTNTYIKCTNTKDDDVSKDGRRINDTQVPNGENGKHYKEVKDKSPAKCCQILIKGASLDVMEADDLIDTIVENQRNNLLEKIYVNQSDIGLIIGAKGVTIKRISNESGAKVSIKGDSRNVTAPCPIEIRGTPEQIEKAKEMINGELKWRSHQGYRYYKDYDTEMMLR